MVEKIIINPSNVRAYGNIVDSHTQGDYSTHKSVVSKIKETVNNIITPVYNLSYSVYGFILGMDVGDKQLYLQVEEADTFTLGFDSSNKQLYVVNYTVESVSFGFSNKQLYIEVGE